MMGQLPPCDTLLQKLFAGRFDDKY
jgi:hypothetical protein